VTTTRLVFNTSPPFFLGWGGWVDRGLYSGCGAIVRGFCFPFTVVLGVV